ncbi:MAG TPA: hypothetical protein VMM92_03270, partial [Thermoanaerobaculia bacterium]|nr:hypothetical protein [Thermoanaerobaculia bacterium]
MALTLDPRTVMIFRMLAATALAGLLLPPDLPVRRDLAAGQTQELTVALPDGQPYLVTVEQQGIDVEVEVFGPGGEKIAAVDSPFDRQGTESLLLAAREEGAAGKPGAYRIAVHAREPGAPPAGSFTLRVSPLPQGPGAADRLAAEIALTRAGALYREATADARRRALPL